MAKERERGKGEDCEEKGCASRDGDGVGSAALQIELFWNVQKRKKKREKMKKGEVITMQNQPKESNIKVKKKKVINEAEWG